MTAILGISALYHDSAAALVVDGRIVAAAQEERFTRKKHDADFPRNAVDYCLREAGISAAESRLRRLLRQADHQVRAAAGNLSRLRAERISLVPASHAAVAQGKAARAAADPQSAQGPVPRAVRLHRSSRVARGQRVLSFAVRRSGDPHDRRRRRVVHDLLRDGPRQPHRADARDPLPALARPALLGVHLLRRLSRQQRRIQADGPGSLWRARLQRPHPPSISST